MLPQQVMVTYGHNIRREDKVRKCNLVSGLPVTPPDKAVELRCKFFIPFTL